MNLLEKAAGSAVFTGYIPFAPGTFGSAAALAIYLIPGFELLFVIIPASVVVTLAGIKIGDKFEAEYGKDPSQCTIDEVAGMWISLIAVPKTAACIIFVFIVWRIFDILKPPPASTAEKLNGGLGIMLDDVISGIYTLITAHLTFSLTENFSFINL